MRLNISCLLAVVLRCNVTAEIISEVVEEKKSVTLSCPHPVVGDVTWSRETNGLKVDILTAGGDGDRRHIHDPGKRYGSQADKSLHIRRVNISDSGRFLCNNKPAADLTVIPPGTLRHATEKTSITLTCPPDVRSDVPTWSRDAGDMRHLRRFIFSSVNKTLTIKGLKPGDSGLYYCDGKPAAYLTVTKDGKKTTTTATTTTTTTTTPSTTTTTKTTTTKSSTTTTATPAADTGNKTTTTNTPEEETAEDQQTPPGLVIGTSVSLLLFLIVIIIVCVSWRRRCKSEGGFSGNEDRYHVYDEIRDGSVIQTTNGLQSFPDTTATFYTTDFPAGSNQDDPTYSTIPDVKPAEHERDTSPDTECQYSLISSTFPAGQNKGSSQPTGDVYFLLEKPKTPANSSDQCL